MYGTFLLAATVVPTLMSHKTGHFFDFKFFLSLEFRRCRSIFASFSTMTTAGPQNRITRALAEMSASTEHVNVRKFARLHGIASSTLSDAWRKLCAFQSTPLASNDELASNLAHHRVEGRGRHSNRALTDGEELLVIDSLHEQFPHGFNN